ncbi:MAG: hypothetical protein ACLU4J_20520 [Butyricimonas paravirosa]
MEYYIRHLRWTNGVLIVRVCRNNRPNLQRLTIDSIIRIDLTVFSFVQINMQETPFYSPSETSPGQNYSKRALDIWSPSNTTGKYPRLVNYTMEENMRLVNYYQWVNGLDLGGNSFSNYDYWFKNMSYWRISSIRLGYNLPRNIES